MPATIQLPKALEFLRFPARYKVAYGGRDAAKSWGFVRELLKRAYTDPVRILCAREIQKSIKDSVHKLIADQIKVLEMQDFFAVKDTSIVGANGSEFLFEGLRYNIDNIRSKEGIDICAVFEAKNVSKNSWDVLLPTIRKPGSEIWIEFNPELESDETYKRWVTAPPPGAVIRKVSYRDNPWLSEESRRYVYHLKETKPDDYLHVYEGHCRVTLDGAIYADELRTATADGRITRVPYDESVPVQTFWDLGWADCTSIWFAQKVGFEYRIIDCYQDRLKKLAHYLKVLQEKPYIYEAHYLPHDADNESLGSDSIAKTMRKMGYKVVVVPRVADKPSGLKASREIFGACWFDQEHCADGLQALRHYRYEIDEHGQWGKYPMHDENSHYADAFEQFARSINRKHDIKAPPQIEIVQWNKDTVNQAWMG